MERSLHKTLVTWDFSEKSQFAVAHAVKLSRQLGTQIELLHVVKKDSEIQDALTQLEEEATKVDEAYGVKPLVKVLVGSIFHTIGDYTKTEDVKLVVMGTHGIKGMQKFTGSWALKVVASSEAPFIVVQDMPKVETYDKIVFPVNFKAENKEKLIWAIYLAKYFNSKIYLFKPPVDDGYYLTKVNNNLIFAKKHLKHYGVDFELHTAEKASRFEDEMLQFAQDIEAELVLIMTTKGIGLGDYIFGASEQYIIANSAKVPIMCVNPRKDVAKANYSSNW
ncbi:MAG: universal stress protein [Salinivirgaceae bacterium]|jgi:nucleotide-binding universal stress UspA family protein|nr:universal stress protein [Salinivirgaceae bacterium]